MPLSFVVFANHRSIGSMLTFPASVPNSESRRAEFRANAIAALQAFAGAMAHVGQNDAYSEVKKAAITAIKHGAKHYTAASNKYVYRFMPALMAATRDINLSVKYVADRALKYLLDGGSQQGVNAFVTSCEQSQQDQIKFVKDYSKKILAGLPEDSDNEGDSRW
jgi:ABC-type transporter MlaC component